MKFCEWLKESRESENPNIKDFVRIFPKDYKPKPSPTTFYPPIDEKEKTHG